MIHLFLLSFIGQGASTFPIDSRPEALDYPKDGIARLSFAYIDHASDFNITIGEFESRQPCENRLETLPDGSSKRVGVSIAKFKVLDSTQRAPGQEIKVVWAGQELVDTTIPPYAQCQPGVKYLLITFPQSSGNLCDYDSTGYSSKPLALVRTIQVASSSEELASVMLLTSAMHLEPGPTPSEKLAWSAVDCALISSGAHRGAVCQFLENLRYPDPPGDAGKLYAPKVALPRPENSVTRAIRTIAANSSPDLSVTLMSVLSAWKVDHTNGPLLEALAKCAVDPSSSIGDMRFGWDSSLSDKQFQAKLVNLLVLAANSSTPNYRTIAALILVLSPSLSLEQDRPLAVWLDCSDQLVRFNLTRHFAKSRGRTDLSPVDPPSGNDRMIRDRDGQWVTNYPDLGDKVDAWKDYFLSHK